MRAGDEMNPVATAGGRRLFQKANAPTERGDYKE